MIFSASSFPPAFTSPAAVRLLAFTSPVTSTFPPAFTLSAFREVSLVKFPLTPRLLILVSPLILQSFVAPTAVILPSPLTVKLTSSFVRDTAPSVAPLATSILAEVPTTPTEAILLLTLTVPSSLILTLPFSASPAKRTT